METTISKAWQGSKLLIKGLIIAGLVLLLLIPAWLVRDLIEERQASQQEAFTEVSSKWAGRQHVTGPVLVVPYEEQIPGGKELTKIRKLAYLLPEKLEIKAEVKPEKRYRGIYEVMLYSASTDLKGHFNAASLSELKIDPALTRWDEAYICMDIADVKGITDPPAVKWKDAALPLKPSAVKNAVADHPFMAPVSIAAGETVSFSCNIRLNGSEHLMFTPAGRETDIRLESSWPDPSFTGAQLPDHEITDNGFTAFWKSYSHSRSFPQVWSEQKVSLRDASVGASFFIPVNAYQKTMRSVKYAALCIILTFAAFFIIETMSKKSAHPLQYALIGIALILFYVLLLSFSEYTGFNAAYIIAGAATVGLIAWFVKGVLQSGRFTTILSLVLVLMYGYLFSILQLQDYSLLLGSIGLFITLAVIMNYTRRIKW